MRSPGHRPPSAAPVSPARATISAVTALGMILSQMAPLPVLAAGDVLRRGPAPAAGSPSAAQLAAPTAPPSATSGGALRGDVLARTTAAVHAVRLAQAQARAAAQAAVSNIPNGLKPGGLVVADGATPGSNLWLGAQSPTESTAGGHTTVDIKQQAAKAILTWQEFNVGKDTTLKFDQAGNKDWIALNRVNDPSASPSQILGQIKADGQVYILNKNGILFGGASQINTATLVASSLNISDENFQKEFVTSNWQQTPTFQADPGVTAGLVKVEAGAHIQTDASGRVFLLGGNVENHGTISTPDGQTILAAGQSAYIKASTESTLRGWEIEVAGNGNPDSSLGNAISTGEIIAERGNITLVGKNVTVAGRLAATTSVTANGSVFLHARDNARADYADYTGQFEGIRLYRAGDVRIAENTMLDILPEFSSTETVAAAALLDRSQIDIHGKTIQIGRGATLLAPGGDVSLKAEYLGLDTDYSVQTPEQRAEAFVYIDHDVLIDVSGTLGVVVDGLRNFVQVELRGNELRDNPLLYGLLYGKKVWVDLRDTGTFDDPFMADVEWIEGRPGTWIGSPLFDATGYINQLRRGVGELTTTGGDITVSAYGDIVVREGAVLDVSGGTVGYTAATGQVTRLRSATGEVVDVNQGVWGENYTGIAGTWTLDHGRWGFSESWSLPLNKTTRVTDAYTEGKAAGTVSLSAERVALDGRINAHVTLGERQLGNAAAPIGGTLILGNKDFSRLNPTWNYDYRLTGVEITAEGAWLDEDFTFGDRLAGDFRTPLSSLMLEESGIGSLEIYATEDIKVVEGTSLDLGTRGSAVLAAREITVDGALRAAGGSITLRADLAGQPRRSDSGPGQPEAPSPRPPLWITLGENAVLDVSGQWVNDFMGAGNAPVAIDGGTVTLITNELTPYNNLISLGGVGVGSGVITLTQGSLIDVSGGGYVNPRGRLARLGNAGSIAIGATEVVLGDDIATYDGLRGHALATTTSAGRGGRLSLTHRAIQIGGERSGEEGDATLYLDATFFQRGGFSDYALHGLVSLSVEGGAHIQPLPQSRLILDPAAHATGTALSDLGPLVVLPEGHRSASRLRLAASSTAWLYAAGADYPTYRPLGMSGLLTLAEGSVLDAGIGGEVSLRSAGQVVIAGTITAPGGKIYAGPFSPTLGGGGGVWLASTARLLAPGAWLPSVNLHSLRTGRVLSGGSIVLDASVNGRVVTEAGSLIDVSGGLATLDLPLVAASYWERSSDGIPLTAPREVWSDAGSVTILMNSNGGYLDGGYRASGAVSAAADGTFTAKVGLFPASERLADFGTAAFLLRQDSTPVLPSDSQPGQAIPGTGSRAFLSADTLTDGGFGTLALAAPGSVIFDGDVRLAASRAITLDAPTLRIAATAENSAPSVLIEAPWVSLGSTIERRPTSSVPAASTGLGTLVVEAGLIDFAGYTALSSIGDAQFHSTGDIRMVGASVLTDQVDEDGESLGRNIWTLASDLRAVGAVTFWAGQLYPASGVVATIHVTGAGARITIESPTGVIPAAPFSAGGSLALTANGIVQNGVLRAPLGMLSLDGGRTGTVTLGEGSLTSVSLDGLTLPWGEVINGNWFGTGGSATTDMGTVGGSLIIWPLYTAPEKTVTLNGRNIDVQAGAVIDLSGGGDITAAEFVPGTGGSRDILSAPGVYAVVPSLQASLTPAEIGSSLGAGDQVWLSGVPGLAAGYYTLLPARYALLPGAFRVTVHQSSADLPSGVSNRRPDGSYLVSGYFGSSLAGDADSRTGIFKVMPADVVRTFTEYAEYTGNQFFTDRALERDRLVQALPVDAGQLILSALRTLNLEGMAKTAAGEGGRGALIDITADSIAVIASGADPLDDYSVNLDGAALSRFGAGSLLLGGTRTITADGIVINAVAERVLVANDEASALTAPEVLLVARTVIAGEALDGTGVIELAGGSVIRAEGAVTGQVLPLRIGVQPGEDEAAAGTGMGAFVGVSNAALDLTRVDVAAAESPTLGLLTVGGGVTLQSSGAILLDATSDTRVSADAVLRAPSLEIASSLISLGSAPENTGGFVVGADTLADFADTTRLVLRSYSLIDFHDVPELGLLDADGNPLFRELMLDGVALVQRGAEDVTLRGESVTLRNTSASSTAVGPEPVEGGSLTVVADTLTLAAGDSRLLGFDAVAFTADDLRFNGIGSLSIGTEAAPVDVAVTAPRISASGDATHGLSTYGALTLVGGTAPAPATEADFGGGVSLFGKTLTVDAGHIDLRSGSLRLEAIQDLVIGAGSTLDSSGRVETFFDVTRTVPAGSIALVSQTGDVIVESGALLDVTAGSSDGDAGTLSVITPEGTLELRGTARGGSFALDAGEVADFAGLNASLNDGGFAQKRSFNLRSGDFTIDGTTRTRELEIVAAAGSLTVASDAELIADGAKPGSIRLIAADDLTIVSGARLSAIATDGQGGRVELISAGGDLAFRSGASIDVTGSRDGGLVTLRAGLDATTGDYRLTDAAGAVTGARRVDAEAVRIYDLAAVPTEVVTNLISGATVTRDVATINGALVGSIQTNATSWLADHKATTLARLGKTGDAAFHLVTGVEIRSEGDLSFGSPIPYSGSSSSSPWTLSTTAAGDYGALTLRAAGNLTLHDSITALDQNNLSWSLRLVGGADLSSADPLAVRPLFALPSDTGHVRILRTVATGTGDIDVRAGRDFQLVRTQVRYRQPTGNREINTLDALRLRGTNVSTWTGLNGFMDAYLYTAGRRVDAADGGNSGGGSIRIAAGQDILGTSRNVSLRTADTFDYVKNQVVTDWIRRGSTTDGAWWSIAMPTGQFSSTAFSQGVGTLGGGDIVINAGRDLNSLTIVAPTSGRASAGGLSVWGGGDITVNTGRDALGNIFYVAQGDGTLRIGRDLAGATINQRLFALVAMSGSGEGLFENLFALGDGTWDIVTRGDAHSGWVFNPTMLARSSAPLFSTYTERSAFSIASIAGDVSLSRPLLATPLTYQDSDPRFPSSGIYHSAARYLYPGSLDVVAWNGSILLGSDSMPRQVDSVLVPRIILFPAANGDLNLLAAESIRLPSFDQSYQVATDPASGLIVSDVDPASMPGVFNPTSSWDDIGYRIREPLLDYTGAVDRQMSHSASLYRADDVNPVRIYARDGDIKGRWFPSSAQTAFSVVSPKPALIRAGRDIIDLNFYGQNLTDDQVTVIQAGRDIRQQGILTLGGWPDGNAIVVGGSGRLEVTAGRNLDLNKSAGIQAIGNQLNPYLSKTRSADIALTAGVGAAGPDYAAFAALYLDPAAAIAGLRHYAADLAAYMREKTGDDTLDASAAWLAFQNLPDGVRAAFVRKIFYRELAAVGTYAAESDEPTKYNPGFDALSALFYSSDLLAYMRGQTGDAALDLAGAWARFQDPTITEQQRNTWHNGFYALLDEGNVTPYAGDLSLRYSQIKSIYDGSIDLMVPGGSIDGGLARVGPDISTTATVTSNGKTLRALKTADALGILALRGGDISIFADGDMIVNQSRVFAIGGGDIVIWSSNGDINAGKGAKTAAVAPPPRIIYDAASGSFTIEFTGETAGSGIGTLISSTGGEPGDVYLMAPRGTVDAGDAGIRVSGNLVLAAQSIRGADNIEVAGVSLGVPNTTVNVAAVTAASNTVAAAAQEAVVTRPRVETPVVPSIITVETVGYGPVEEPPPETASLPLGGTPITQLTTNN
ncbi:filamentous hemagglutinin N-terminal domain-containing protein [Opitutaceae bacterium TAV4]|nr:filamentous hemagglutinin N-terminal domain-containing protein [Opitutaceae bacterium TAV4]RRK02101.1 filamentous hemagglutinin N-terminal domain-containing protein [Opitutaceae bacterium TAV3]